MRYLALACDYDGTIATHGRVGESTVSALERVRDSGRRLILVTGRRLEDLSIVFPRMELFDCIVAENGAVLYEPVRRRETLLTEPPSQQFIAALHGLGVEPVDIGRAIVATWMPHDEAVLQAIHQTGLELQMTFNKGAIMVLPSGVNKTSGLRQGLHCLGLSAHNTIGVGDAENDHAFLALCEFSVAVANALDAVKRRVDLVTRGDHGAGVEELIEDLLADDLRRHDARVHRHDLLLGIDDFGREARIPPYGTRMLICGPSGSGKSTVASALLERLSLAEYQFCVIDPEGDYENFEHAVTVGDEERMPTTDQVFQLLDRAENVIVSLLAVPIGDRPAFAARLLQRMHEHHRHNGRPHWIVLDEAHHMLPASWRTTPDDTRRFASEILVTVHPRSIAPGALSDTNAAIAVGPGAGNSLEELAEAVGRPLPSTAEGPDRQGLEVLLWFPQESAPPVGVRVEPAEAERRRHRRKYAEGDLREKSFYFRGPEGRLRLRAQNLTLFLQMAEGVDDDTWLHHLRQGDYSRWARDAIKDAALAESIEEIERTARDDARESLARVRAAIEELYTGPA